MPIFEYRCEECGREFEEIVFSEGEVVACPKCGSNKTGKLMSCCRFKSGGGGGGEAESTSSSSSSSSCAGCSGGNCATCH